MQLMITLLQYLWHKQLAHMSVKGLQLLAKQSLISMAKDKSSNLMVFFLSVWA